VPEGGFDKDTVKVSDIQTLFAVLLHNYIKITPKDVFQRPD